MRVIIKNNYDECSLWAAHYVAYKIKAFRPTPEKPFSLTPAFRAKIYKSAQIHRNPIGRFFRFFLTLG